MGRKRFGKVQQMKNISFKKKLIIVCVIIVVACLFYYLYNNYYQDILMIFDSSIDRKIVIEELRSHGPLSAVVLLLLICTPFVPYSVLVVFTALSYGAFLTSIFAILGAVIRSLFFIYIFDKVNHLVPNAKSFKIIQALKNSKHPVIELSLAYMMPIIPKFAINYTITLLDLPLKEVIIILIIGSAPKSILLAYDGDALLHGDIKNIIIIFCVAIILLVLLYLFKFKNMLGQKEK